MNTPERPIIGNCRVFYQSPEEEERDGTNFLFCNRPVRVSPSGLVCDAGHGGAPYEPTLTPPGPSAPDVIVPITLTREELVAFSREAPHEAAACPTGEVRNVAARREIVVPVVLSRDEALALPLGLCCATKNCNRVALFKWADMMEMTGHPCTFATLLQSNGWTLCLSSPAQYKASGATIVVPAEGTEGALAFALLCPDCTARTQTVLKGGTA